MLDKARQLMAAGKSRAAAAVAVQAARKRGASRSDRQDAAEICLQAKSPLDTLRILQRTVLSSRGLRADARPGERILYALALSERGAMEQAARLVSGPEMENHPVSYLALARFRMLRWDWFPSEEIRRHLDKYRSRLSKRNHLLYLQRVISTLTFSEARYEEAIQVIEEAWTLIAGPKAAQRDGSGMDVLDFLQLETQLAILTRDTKRFDFALKRLMALVNEDLDPFYLHWVPALEAIGELCLPGRKVPKAEALRHASRARERLLEAGFWERARSVDYHLALLSDDKEIWARLYFGTSFPPARALVLRLTEGRVTIPATYRLFLGPVETGAGGGKEQEIPLDELVDRSGSVVRRALEALVHERYRPLDPVALHEAIYPGEYFNPHSSPVRVRQAIKRLRSDLKAAKSPVDVRASEGGYALTATRPCVILVPRDARPTMDDRLAPPESLTHRRLALWRKLAPLFTADSQWTAGELASRLEVSQPTISRILLGAERAGWIKREGKARRTVYRRA